MKFYLKLFSILALHVPSSLDMGDKANPVKQSYKKK